MITLRQGGRSRRLLLITASALLAAGCVQEDTGQPTTVTTDHDRTTGTAESGVLPTSEVPVEGEENDGSVADELAAMNPCEVLSPAELTDLGFDPTTAELDDVGVLYSCRVKSSTDTEMRTWIQLDPEFALDDLNFSNYERSDTEIGGLRAFLLRSKLDERSCQFSMDLSRDSSASVSVTWAENTEQACEVAREVAEAVTPKLPRKSS